MFGYNKLQPEVFFLPHGRTDYDLMPLSKESRMTFFLYRNGGHGPDAKAVQGAKRELVLGTLILSLAVVVAALVLA